MEIAEIRIRSRQPVPVLRVGGMSDDQSLEDLTAALMVLLGVFERAEPPKRIRLRASSCRYPAISGAA